MQVIQKIRYHLDDWVASWKSWPHNLHINSSQFWSLTWFNSIPFFFAKWWINHYWDVDKYIYLDYVSIYLNIINYNNIHFATIHETTICVIQIILFYESLKLIQIKMISLRYAIICLVVFYSVIGFKNGLNDINGTSNIITSDLKNSFCMN